MPTDLAFRHLRDPTQVRDHAKRLGFQTVLASASITWLVAVDRALSSSARLSIRMRRNHFQRSDPR
jgi:hypothetical protein